MGRTTTITTKYQIYIPREIRDKVGLEKTGKAKIKAKGLKIIIEPIKSDFLNLGGKFELKNPTPAETIREKIEYTESK